MLASAPGAEVHNWLSSFWGRFPLQMLSGKNVTVALYRVGEGGAPGTLLVSPNLPSVMANT